MEVRITATDGKTVVITTRDQEARFDGKINHISSTEAQPYISAHFAADGTIIGGRTLSESYLKQVLSQAAKAGLKVEHIS